MILHMLYKPADTACFQKTEIFIHDPKNSPGKKLPGPFLFLNFLFKGLEERTYILLKSTTN